MTNDSSTDGARGHRSRALVLGGGGPVGRAWEIGLVDGFAGQGIDFWTADFIIGTSAGAVVGAQLALKQGSGAPPKIAAPPPVQSDLMADLAAAMVRAGRRLEKRERLFPTIDARNSTGAPITQEPMGAPLIFEISGYPIISPLISKYCSRVISPRA